MIRFWVWNSSWLHFQPWRFPEVPGHNVGNNLETVYRALQKSKQIFTTVTLMWEKLKLELATARSFLTQHKDCKQDPKLAWQTGQMSCRWALVTQRPVFQPVANTGWNRLQGSPLSAFFKFHYQLEVDWVVGTWLQRKQGLPYKLTGPGTNC